MRITLVVAGFDRSRIDALIKDGRSLIRGRQVERKRRVHLHWGIAARRFRRVFPLVHGMRVVGAELVDGLLRIDPHKPEP